MYECVLQMYALDTYVCVSACSYVHVCARVPTGTHSCTRLCAGQVLQDAVLESRVGTWQVSDRRVTTEGRPTLNSAWAARELLEGAGCELQQPGAGPSCWGSLPPALGGQAPPLSGGAESVLLQKETWAKARHGTGWYGGVFTCFHRICGSKRLSVDSLSPNGCPLWTSLSGVQPAPACGRPVTELPDSLLLVPAVGHLGLWETR